MSCATPWIHCKLPSFTFGTVFLFWYGGYHISCNQQGLHNSYPFLYVAHGILVKQLERSSKHLLHQSNEEDVPTLCYGMPILHTTRTAKPGKLMKGSLQLWLYSKHLKIYSSNNKWTTFPASQLFHILSQGSKFSSHHTHPSMKSSTKNSKTTLH